MVIAFAASLPFVYAAWRLLAVLPHIAGSAAMEAPGMGLFHAYLLHVLIFFCFVECFYHVERAVTLRMLIEILEAPKRAKALRELSSEYTIEEMIGRRMEVLEQNSFVRSENGRWKLTPKGRLFAVGMLASSWIFQSRGQQERI